MFHITDVHSNIIDSATYFIVFTRLSLRDRWHIRHATFIQHFNAGKTTKSRHSVYFKYEVMPQIQILLYLYNNCAIYTFERAYANHIPDAVRMAVRHCFTKYVIDFRSLRDSPQTGWLLPLNIPTKKRLLSYVLSLQLAPFSCIHKRMSVPAYDDDTKIMSIAVGRQCFYHIVDPAWSQHADNLLAYVYAACMRMICITVMIEDVTSKCI